MSDIIRENYPGFHLTQTCTKDLEKDETCPSRWKGLWLEKTIVFPSNEDMDKGKFFEYLALGAGAKGTDQEVTDLPRVFGSRKSIDQVRIEDQAERFKSFFDPASPEFQGLSVLDTQLKLFDTSTNSEGTIDFVATDTLGGVWINDLKLTKDLTNTRTQYGWGHDWSQLDMLQMIHYSMLYQSTYGVVPRVALWVFDYTPQKRVRVGEIKISSKALATRDIRMGAAYDVITTYEKEGWTTLPSESECRTCTIQCKDRWKPGPLERIIVNI